MVTPVERLEFRKQVLDCRVCTWLHSLPAQERKDWAVAISNPRYSAGAVAAEIQLDQEAAKFAGLSVGSSSIDRHRQRSHR